MLSSLPLTSAPWLCLAAFVRLTAPGGQEIEINPAEISTMRMPREVGHFAEGVECVIFMTNGRFVAVTEPCRDVMERIEETK